MNKVEELRARIHATAMKGEATAAAKKRTDASHYNHEVIISAYNEEYEPWRIARLNRALGYASALYNDVVPIEENYHPTMHFERLIYRLHDHKGILTVFLRIDDLIAYSVFEDAWLKHNTETDVEFKLPGEVFDGLCPPDVSQHKFQDLWPDRELVFANVDEFEADDWMRENATGKSYHVGNCHYFTEHNDAVLFKVAFGGQDASV